MSDDTSRELRWSDGPGIVESAARYKAALAVTLVLSVIAGFLLSELLPTTYEATATIVVSDVDAFNKDFPDPERRVQQEQSRVTSRAVYIQTADEVGGGLTARAAKEMVNVSADPMTGEIEVTAAAASAQQAVDLANNVVLSYQRINQRAAEERLNSALKVLEEQSQGLRNRIVQVEDQVVGDTPSPTVAQQLGILQSQLGSLDARGSELAVDVALYGSGIEEIERATPPDAPASPKPLRNAALAGVLGLVAAAALAYWRAGYVDSLKLDPARTLGAPLLAEIPEFKRPSAERMNPLLDVEAAEAYQFLLASFEYAVARSNAGSVLVTSASPGDGKSFTSLQLARALAVQGRDVMLVDADIRARGLSTLLRAEDKSGLVALAEGANLGSVIRRYRISEHVRLSFVPAGEPAGQPTGLLGTKRYRDVISKIIADNDLTIIDSGPLLTVADASAISALVSGIILVIDANVSRENLTKLRSRTRLIPTPVLGIVVNRVSGVGLAPYPYGPAPAGSRRLRRLLSGRGDREHRASLPAASSQ